jgi:hypothetical protein
MVVWGPKKPLVFYSPLRVDSSICNIGRFIKNSLNYKKNNIGRLRRKKRPISNIQKAWTD